MGFLSQVPLSARFLLYRAVRGGLATLRQARASATQQNVYSPCGLAGQTTAERIYHCHKIFAHGGGWIFSSHPRANLYKKGSPGVEKKKMLRQHCAAVFLLTLRPTSIRKVHLRVSRKNAAAARVRAPCPNNSQRAIYFRETI